MEKQKDVLGVVGGDVLYDPEQTLVIRQFCIDALAAGVPKYRNREQAADVIVEWFPGDQLALAALYRTISQNRPLQVA